MKKLIFLSDYVDGVSPEIMIAMQKENGKKDFAYGCDETTTLAKKKIRKIFGESIADIFFVSGGTQANTIALSAMTGRADSIIAASTSHISNHEAGSIEALGNKIHIINSLNGKINGRQIQKIVDSHKDVHMVKPKVVAISQPTERGVIYSSEELREVGEVCRLNELYLFVDGSRLANAMVSKDATVAVKDLEKYCDVLCVGGTKNGAMCAEALLVFNSEISILMPWMIKQRGAMLSKSRFMAAQFLELFNSDGLFFKNARNANEMAVRLINGLKSVGLYETQTVQTNQVFVNMPSHLFDFVSSKYELQKWSDLGPKSVEVRLVTSWNDNESDVDEFLKIVKDGVNLTPI